MAKEFLHKEGLTKLVEKIKAWAKGAFLGKDATITKSSGTNKGVSVSIQGSVSEPSVSVSVTTSGVSGDNSGVVSGSEVKAYVDANAATKDTFKAATSSSNAVNGLVPAPSSANATKFLRGDGAWTTPPLATNNTDGLMGADDKTKLDQSVAMVTPLTGEDGSCILEVERNDGTYLEFQVPKVDAAKEADNALNLDGTPLRKIHEFVCCNDKLFGDTEGWYRIARSRDFANSPRSFMLFLERQYGYDSPESYVFSISNTMGDYFSITQLSGAASSRLIDKIRVVNSASASDYVYVDIHINPASGLVNPIFWGVVGNAVAYNRDEVVFNPELPGVNVEFETVNGFKTNNNIYEGAASLSEKYLLKRGAVQSLGVIGANHVQHNILAYTYQTEDNGGIFTGGIINFGVDGFYGQLNGAINTGRVAYRYYNRDLGGYSIWYNIAMIEDPISAQSNNGGVKVQLGGTIGLPTVSVTTTTGGVSAANSGVVSGKEVKDYVDANAATKSVFSAATSSSVGSNGLVPAPSSANATKFLRGDGTWRTPTITKDSVTSALGYTPAKEVPNTMVWGGILNTAAYATDYAVGTVLKVTTSESLSILKDGSLITSSLASGTNVIVSHESYMSGSSYNSGKVFVIF